MGTKYLRVSSIFGLVGLFTVGVFGCGTGDDRLREKAQIESQQSAQNQAKAENERLEKWAEQMEADLDRRHSFFEALTGVYEGTDVSGNSSWSVRVIFSPSFPRYPNSDRPRTIEELSYELNNLYLNAQVVTWSPLKGGDDAVPEFAAGCVFESIRPDLRLGRMFLASENCKSTFGFYLSELDENGEIISSKEPESKSASIANDVVKGKRNSVNALLGTKQTNLTSRQFKMELRKVVETE